MRVGSFREEGTVPEMSRISGSRQKRHGLISEDGQVESLISESNLFRS